MTKDEALRLALEALENLGNHDHVCPQWPTYAEPENYPKCNCGYDQAITAIKAALEAKDEPERCTPNCEALLQKLVTQRKEKGHTENCMPLADDGWNHLPPSHSELVEKSLPLEAKDEPLQSVWNTLPSNKDVENAMRMKRLQQLSTPPRRTPITDEDIRQANHHMVCGAYDYSFKQGVRWAEKVHGIKWEWEK